MQIVPILSKGSAPFFTRGLRDRLADCSQRHGFGFLTCRMAVIAATVFVLSSALPGWAEGYRCEIQPIQARTYIASNIEIFVDAATGTASIRDDMISQTGRDRVFGRVETENRKRVTISWILADVAHHPSDYSFRDLKLLYRLTIQKSDGSARIGATDTAARRITTFSGVGNCVRLAS